MHIYLFRLVHLWYHLLFCVLSWFHKRDCTFLQVFVILHIVALVHYIRRILNPKTYRMALTLVLTVGTYVLSSNFLNTCDLLFLLCNKC